MHRRRLKDDATKVLQNRVVAFCRRHVAMRANRDNLASAQRPFPETMAEAGHSCDWDETGVAARSTHCSQIGMHGSRRVAARRSWQERELTLATLSSKLMVGLRKMDRAPRRLAIAATAISMAWLMTAAASARDSRAEGSAASAMTQPCAPGDHAARPRNRHACKQVHLREHAAMVRKGRQSAAVTRPYDFPNSYVLHGPRF
jgi:hypothetical protein